MTEKTASVHWEGPGKKGQGQISTETGALDRHPYGFASPCLCGLPHGGPKVGWIGFAPSLVEPDMHQYRVAERWVDDKLCVLQCKSGRYHLARVLNVMPSAEAALDGVKPHLGFDILVCPESGAIFRVIFEAIDEAHVVQPPGRTWKLPAGAAQASAQASGAAN